MCYVATFWAVLDCEAHLLSDSLARSLHQSFVHARSPILTARSLRQAFVEGGEEAIITQMGKTVLRAPVENYHRSTLTDTTRNRIPTAM